jgi:hypothetical protein
MSSGYSCALKIHGDREGKRFPNLGLLLRGDPRGEQEHKGGGARRDEN